VRAFRLRESGTPVLNQLPLGGVFGFNQFSAALAAGLPMVLPETFEPVEAAQLIERWKPAWLMGTDDLWHRLFEAGPAGDRPFPSLQWGGTAAFNSALADLPARAEARGVRLCGLFGMSEIQAFYSRRRVEEPLDRRQLAGGDLTSPLAHVRVRNPETGELSPPGEAGELEAMGPSLMVGYFGDDAATRAALTGDGYLKTGDFGMLDDQDGHRFTFLNRMGDVLRLSGFLVNPQEIEAHLQAHPTVDRAQVVGVARPDGVRAAAFVMPRAGAAFDEAALIEHCRRGLANYKTPARVFAIDEFPVTASPNGAKIQRGKLRDMAAAKLG
jgi:fatty-acyl-CoA synthase